MSLEDLIKDRIRRHGNITVADYMEIALSHSEHGYYMKRDPFGGAGDFTTAPEISQVFGEIIAVWLAHNWQVLGSPKEVALVELGAGRGTLMADILRATKNIKNFHDSISIHIVEISPALKQKQWKALANKHVRIEWHENFGDIPELPILLVANEFFDALPIRQFIGDGERMVGIVDDELAFVSPLKEGVLGNIIESCEAGISIIKKISEHIEKYSGAALIIDYGYIHGSNGDTLQAMKNHSYHPVLHDVGNADITAHVDFLALSNAAKKYKVNVHGTIPQGQFLMRLGAGARTTKLCEISNEEQQKSLVSGLKRIADPNEMGELFKVMAITSKQIEKAEGF